tara:strand:+ start:206 stop:1279 length:1074 start_codon:yes stop_codon:yes gene_type:complete
MLAVLHLSVGLQLAPPALPSSLRAYGDAAQACAAVARQPSSSEAWRELGRLLHGKGRLEAARLALSRAVAVDSRDAPSLLAHANVLRSIGRFEEATTALLAHEALTDKRDQSLCYYRSPVWAEEVAPIDVDGGAALDMTEEVMVTPLATAEECEWVIATAEAHNAAQGGWGNPPPRYAPAGTSGDAVRAPHMLVADSADLLAWFNVKCRDAVWPTLARQFGAATAEEMWLYDAFLLRFDGAPGRSGLGIHVDDDGLGLSINLLLSDPAAGDFEGGGTWFEELDTPEGRAASTVTPRRGEMVSHHGGMRHASVPTTAGLRYILVAFFRAPSLVVEPPAYVSGYCATSRAAAARSRGLE